MFAWILMKYGWDPIAFALQTSRYDVAMLPILTGRLCLRRFETRDAVRLAAYRSDPAVAIYQSWSDMTLADASTFIEHQAPRTFGQYDEWFQIAIADREADELLGDIGICLKSPGRIAEIGFTMAPDSQGNGYASEACETVIRRLFALTGIEEIEAIVDARNTAAIKFVKRLGMRLLWTGQSEFKGEICTEHRFVCERDVERGR